MTSCGCSMFRRGDRAAIRSRQCAAVPSAEDLKRHIPRNPPSVAEILYQRPA